MDLLAGLALLWAVTSATSWAVSSPAGYGPLVLALYSLFVVLILGTSEGAVPPSRRSGPVGRRVRTGLGPANRITLLRTTLVLPVAGFVPHPEALAPGILWWAILLGTIALVLDGVDGRVARRTGTETEFGARFDMELDAFLMLALSLLVWETGKVGAWVVGIGALRYLFVAAGLVLPRLRASLPESDRRKTICVVQAVALLVCLGPIVPAALAVVVAAVALALLVYSFTVDVGWLLRNGRAASP